MSTDYEQNYSSISGKAVAVLIAVLFSLIIFIDLISWMIHRGGMISTFIAFGSIHNRPASIEVDSLGFLLPMSILLASIGLYVCARTKEFPVSSRIAGIIVAIYLLGGGFILNFTIGEMIVSGYMGANGYGRCPSGDLFAGSGKGSVWFKDYVASSKTCVTQRSATISPAF